MDKKWIEIINNFMKSETGLKLKKFVSSEREMKTIYPLPEDVFRVFKLVPFDKVKIVILGQDPYHDGSADGIAFSSRSDKTPPSLRNIFKDIYNIYSYLKKIEGVESLPFEQYFESNSLESWCNEGILLTNTCLTVEEGKPGSHSGKGWEELIKTILQELDKDEKPKVFMLWGNHAKSFKQYLSDKHKILECGHPSPLGKGFENNLHFLKAIAYLGRKGQFNPNVKDYSGCLSKKFFDVSKKYNGDDQFMTTMDGLLCQISLLLPTPELDLRTYKAIENE